MSRDKENKSFQEKLKQYFKISKPNSPNIIANKEFILTAEILKDLGKDAPINTRLKTMKELGDHVVSSRLERNGVEKLWSCVQDLFLEEYPPEVRHAAFHFLQTLIKGQFDKIDVMRAQFFRFIKHHENPQDLSQRIDLLSVLTNNGKEVEHFEDEIGPFLLNWIGTVGRVGKLPEFLTIVDNVIKFNSPHLDEIILTGFVKHFCVLCCNCNQCPVVMLCLQLLGTVVAYSILPPEALSQFVGTLCRTVNIRDYCTASWKTMKNLLGTHLGHSALFTMCGFLHEPNLRNDSSLLQGCVFYVHMALWDRQPFKNLCCPPSAVLPAFLQAVKCNHASVSYEAILGVQKLVNKFGTDLLDPTWDIVLQILSIVNRQIDNAPDSIPNNMCVVTLHEVLNSIENMIESGCYRGSLKQFYGVISECSVDRPEDSVLKLITFLSRNIRPTENSWLQNLFNLVTKYFKNETRTNIRLKSLNLLSDRIQLYSEYEDELIERIVIPHTQHIADDDNSVVRAEVAKLLVSLSMDYNSTICADLLDILEKLLLRPYEKYTIDNLPTNEAELFDISVLIPGLIQVFAKKIHRLPSSHAVKIHNMFVQFLERHFQLPVFRISNQNRVLILDCFLKMRADALSCLGYPDPETQKIKYSTYLCVTYKPMEAILGSPPPTSPTLSQLPMCKVTYLTLESSFRLILTHLERETDWEVLKFILERLPGLLANKAIVLTRHGNSELNRLVIILCNMISNKSDHLKPKVPRVEFQTAIVSVMIALSSYSNSLDLYHQQQLINTLTKNAGIDPRFSRQTINALTICMVDMRETMMKLLPDVLLRLSKISATTYIAMPILEFLSTLSQLPTVYGNFVGDQYMAVFAIALPYTNPFKYDNYVVSLAYHVISVWFLKCRLPFRKDFVKFIISGLQTNIITPLQEWNQFKLSLSTMNQDSSDRKRSSSLTEQSSRRRTKADTQDKSSLMQKTQRDKTVLTFYEELNETCVDLMARYTYSPCSALPTRLPTAEFLLQGGISKSWMLGNKLITITTSGCTEKVAKHGVCDKCWSICSAYNDNKVTRYARSNSGGADDLKEKVSRQGSADKGDEGKKSDSGELPKVDALGRRDVPICACWCQGWAEVLIRRPTGNVSWVMKLQNQVSFKQLVFEFPLNDVSAMYLPDLQLKPSSSMTIKEKEDSLDKSDNSRSAPGPGSPTRQSLSRQSSQESGDEDSEVIYDDGAKSRNPVRRSNSSPEMANWKNPFVHSKQEIYDPENVEEDNTKKSKKDVRVSCEAIPEEIAGMGTSPPTDSGELAKAQALHPSLLSCHSYPGSSPPKEIDTKPYKTVPPSPNQVASIQPNFSTKGESQGSEKVLERPNNLPNLTSLPPLMSKPPQSPTQTSPRLQGHTSEKDGLSIQKSSSSSVIERTRPKSVTESTVTEKRDRVHTVSIMSTSNRQSLPSTSSNKKAKEILKSGLNPSFIFLQLYHSACFGSTAEVPLLVPPTPVVERAIRILDRMYPYEVHKIGVLYINEGQVDKESEILRNTYGSVRYMNFLQNLGTLIRLADVNPHSVFLGGVVQNGSDGTYMYTHQDDLVMLAFHVATLMPNKENDPHGNHKKAHVGNDNVVIIYNNSGEPFDIATFKSQVTLAYIIVEPLDYNCNKVEVKVKSEELKIIGLNEMIIVSDQSVSILVRQLAIHADLAATVLNSLRSHANDPYASNWLERLRKLKDLRQKVLQETKNQKDAHRGHSEEKDIIQDFTDFT